MVRRRTTRYGARRAPRRGRARARTGPRRMVRKRAYAKNLRKSFRKRVLNISSVKKVDHMMSVRKPDALTPVTLPAGIGPTVINPANGSRQAIGWIATARTNENGPGVPAGPIDDSSRTKDDVFMVGLKEVISLETATNQPFLWRRICFTFVGQEILREQTSAVTGTMYEQSSAGWMRASTFLLGNSVAPSAQFVWTNISRIIFRGVFGIDWNDIIDAPLDRERVHVKYDHTTRISSQNDVGVMRRYQRWHPMRKTLKYNDDESAGGRVTSPLSANVSTTMGDYYVIDIFAFNANAVGADAVSFSPEASLYWHER